MRDNAYIPVSKNFEITIAPFGTFRTRLNALPQQNLGTLALSFGVTHQLQEHEQLLEGPTT
jgi:hypothetical protein